MVTYFRGQLAKAAGLNIETLRFYEKNGLIPIPERTDKGYRIYSGTIPGRLEFIKRAKNSGFTLEEIKHLLSVIDSKIVDQQYVSDLLENKIKDIDLKISSLIGMRTFLKKVKDNFHNPENCPVLHSLLQDE